MEEFLLAVLCIAVVVIAIKLSQVTDAWMAVAELRDLTQRLEARLANLERQLARQAADSLVPPPRNSPHTAEAQVAAAELPSQEVQVSAADFAAAAFTGAAAVGETPAHVRVTPRSAPPPRPVFTNEPPSTWQPPLPAAGASVSLEERLGQNWLSKIGIVLVVLGVATFLGYELSHIGPLGKSLTGFLTALFLLGGGLWLERNPNYRIFARAGIGGGWALLFFTTFALYHVEAMQVLTSQAADLVLMALVDGAMVWHSLRYKSQAVTALAFLLAFATVGISHVTLFSLVAGALLAAALAWITAREYWYELGLAGLCGVYFNHFLWLVRVLPGGGRAGQAFPDLFASAGLLLLYWLIFRLSYILRAPQDGRQEAIASLSAVLNSAGLIGLLKYQSSHPEWAFPALLVLGSIEILLAFIARSRRRNAFLVLATLGSALLLAAVPFRFDGSSWTLLWLFEAEALFMAGILIREKVLRRLGLIAGFFAAGQILLIDTLPILGRRVFAVDTSRHTPVAIALVTAALLFWFNAEFARRRWSEIAEEHFDETALAITSYLAATAMAGAIWLAVPASWLTIAWGALALLLFEAGLRFRVSSIRNQGYAVIAACFLRILFHDLNLDLFARNSAAANHRIYTVVPLIAAYLWVYHRTQTALEESSTDRAAGVLSAWLGTGAAATLLYLEPRPEFVTIGWSLLALVLITAAWLRRRPIFTGQALVLLGASAARALLFNLAISTGTAASFWSTRAATIGVSCAVMLLCLPMAFGIRSFALEAPPASPGAAEDLWQRLLARPEQPFFFVPYALIAVLIAFELRTGMITLGWIALGLAAFLAALPLGERSYRISGLGLLLVGLAKIVLVDIWSLSTADKILTFVITGVVLMLVSFLYSRYRETILKFL